MLERNFIVSEWKVYIIKAQSGMLYTGITKDLKKRFESHSKQKKGARFFNFSSPEKIVFYEEYTNRSQASKREAEIKKMSRAHKLHLIATSQNLLNKLS